MGDVQPSIAAITPASKLRPPRVRHAEIARAALLARDDLAERDLVVICAPGGYGKSTLAIQWATRTDRPIAWATLDETDNDRVALLSTLGSALRQATSAFPLTPLSADEPQYSREVLPGFLAAVADLATPVTVVLDDVHLITSAHGRAILRGFLDALPIGSQAAVVGRSMKAIPLPLWRGQGRVAEVQAAHLSFTVEETEEAIRNFHSGAQAAVVHTASAGWPVAVFLLSQSHEIDHLTNVAEFIETEVLQPMPEDLRQFVIATAALGVVNVDLATRVTGTAAAGHYLAESITTVLMARDAKGWYHFHPLMRDTVVEILRRDDPDKLMHAQARAAAWYLEAGHPDQAVGHAIDSGDAATMGKVVWPAAQAALLQGRVRTVIDWLDRIGPETVDRNPDLSMTAAWASVAGGDYSRVLRHGQQTMRLMPGDWLDHVKDFSIGPNLALLLAVTQLGLPGPTEAVRVARIARENISHDDPTSALSALALGVDLALVDDAEAEVMLQEAAAIARASRITSTEVEALSLLGLWTMAQGRFDAGCGLVDQAEAVFAEHDLGQMHSTWGMLALARVAVAAHRRDAAGLRSAVSQQEQIRDEVARILPWYRPLSTAVLAFAYVRMSDHRTARAHLEESRGPGLCEKWWVLAERAYVVEGPVSSLTPAELRVWTLLRTRMTLGEIAGSLYLSRETVKSHAASIYRKLGVSSRREAQDLADVWG